MRRVEGEHSSAYELILLAHADLPVRYAAIVDEM